MRHRPLLIVADIGRTMLLGSIPLVAYLGILHIAYLYGVAFLVGILTLFFDIAYGAFLPSLVERDELIEGNSKLQASIAVAEFVGPSLAGVLIQWLTAPLSLVVDALSFLASALSLLSLRVQETSQETRKERQHFWYELRAGIGNTLYNITSQTLVQTTTPDTLLGRVRSVRTLSDSARYPLVRYWVACWRACWGYVRYCLGHVCCALCCSRCSLHRCGGEMK